MTKRIAAIIFIFACTSIAWFILGGTITYRTLNAADTLRGRLPANWGSPQTQKPPLLTYSALVPETVTKSQDGKKTSETQWKDQAHSIPLETSKIDVTLHSDPRRKGLLWYSTYQVSFDGTYSFRNPTVQEQAATVTFPIPAERAVFDDLRLTWDDSPFPVTAADNAMSASIPLKPSATGTLRVHYRSQGLDTWNYNFGDSTSQVRNFDLHVTTDFDGFDFPENTLGPTTEKPNGAGSELVWHFDNLVSGYPIGIAMPQKLQPGPVAGRISFFAPVSLFFFFFILFILSTVRGMDIHPMNYFFFACAFFSFHLLLAYLVDHISIHASFLICSVVSIALLVSYARLVVGTRFAFREAGLVQFVYLVLFSYAFFFEGFTGLAITIGAILTLFIVMQMTGRVRWAELFSRPIN